MEQKLVDFLDSVQKTCLDTEVLSAPEECLIYSHGCYPREYKWLLQGEYPYITKCVLRPKNKEEISAIMKLANEMHIHIIPYGGGSGIVGGTIPYNGEVILDTKKLKDFSINVVNMTATGGCGLSGAEFENKLNEHGFTCGQYPQSFQSASLGGMTATRAIGTFSTKYGKMDDMTTALEVVLPNGEILSTHKAPKRSTGPELKELFLGSEGTMGIVTAVEMKIYPVSEKRIFKAYTFPRTEDGLEAIRKFYQQGMRPAVVRLYDETEARSRITKHNLEKGFALLVLVFEGLERMIEVESEITDEICRGNGGRPKDESIAIDWLKTRFTTKKMLDYDSKKGGTADAIEVAAPWDCIGNVWREMRNALQPYSDVVDCHFSHVYHNGASVYVIFHSSTEDNKTGEQRYVDCLDIAIRTSLKNGGNVSHHHGVGTAKAQYLPLEIGTSGMNLLKDIKRAVDPNAILNEGVLGL